MKNKFKNTSILITLILIGIIVLVNFISIRLFWRSDLTRNNLYTLSNASKELIRKIDDNFSVKVYFTEDLPYPYNNNRRVLIDLLKEYKAISGTNFKIDFISPSNQDLEKEAQDNGIPPVEVQVVEEDKVEVKRAYMGLSMMYEGRKETLPLVQDLAGLEYNLSSAIKRLTNVDKKLIGLVTGHGETSTERMNLVTNYLNQLYDIIPVDLSSDSLIQQNISAILIINPTAQYSDTAKRALNQYLINGGNIGFFRGNFEVDQSFRNVNAMPVDNNLDDLLANWGIKINKNMLRDAQCATILVTRQQGQLQLQTPVQYPYLIKVTNFNKESIITGQLSNAVIQFASSIDLSVAKNKAIKHTVLASSSEATGMQNDGYLVEPFHQYTEQDFQYSLLPMAVLYEGKFKSFYDDAKPINEKESRIIAVGSGIFMEDAIAQNADDNVTFFANIVDYLTDDSGLISIRAKTVSLPTLDKVSDSTRNLLKYGNMILPPILIILYGIIRWRRRKSAKKMP